MKVLLVNKFYYRRAGAEAYVLDLQAALERAGHETAVFATSHPKNIPTKWSGYFPPYLDFSRSEGLASDLAKAGTMIWSRDAAGNFRRLIRDFRPDVVHLNNIYHHLSPSIVAECGRAKVPAVQTLHDFKLICPNYKLFTGHHRCERCRVYRYWNAVIHRCLNGSLPGSAVAAVEMWTHRLLGIYEKGVHRFITPSAFLRDILIRWGKDGGKIVHVPNLLDLSGLPPRSPEAGEGMLYVGRLEEIKGAMTVIEAAAGAPDLSFRLAGSGPFEADLRQRAVKLGLRNVEFLGFLQREDLYREILKSRAVLVPSVYYDVFPTTALEGGALGKPVIATRLGGLPEIVGDGETGLLVEPEDGRALVDACRRLAYDPELARRLGAAAERRVKALVDPDKHVERIVSIYREVMGQVSR